MSAHHRLVTDTELEVLKALWDLGEGTVRDVLARLEPAKRGWAYTTAQTILVRLQEKGCIASEKRGRAFVFRPLFTRDELLGAASTTSPRACATARRCRCS
jgi:predicted transcriptional regulator